MTLAPLLHNAATYAPGGWIGAGQKAAPDVFLRDDQGMELAGPGGRGVGRAFGRQPIPPAERGMLDHARVALGRTDWVPDLGQDIGSRNWWRGLATCAALCWGAWQLNPGLPALTGDLPATVDRASSDEARTQGVAPLAFGATTGRRMAASALVRPLAETPERPQIELNAALADGDTLRGALQRAGVGGTEAGRITGLVGDAVGPDSLKPGTMLALTLGRRPTKFQPRPLERLAFRAAFDLNLVVQRAGDGLVLDRQSIAIDRTPLHITGTVGAGLYRSARAAGAPARVVETYIKAIAAQLPMGQLGSDDRFDIVADQARAATGEIEVGQLQYAGLTHGRRIVRLVRWGDKDGEAGQMIDPGGTVERRGAMGMPVAGRITSTFGMRMHPLLGFMRMHKGTDIGAPYGSPIYAAVDGIVQFAGRAGGYGNFIKLAHGGGLVTGYGHMSRFAVGQGTRVRRGQVIGYVGSTGISTGPHLHWEVWKNGQPVNPRTLSLSSVQALPAETIRAMRAKIARLIGR